MTNAKTALADLAAARLKARRDTQREKYAQLLEAGVSPAEAGIACSWSASRIKRELSIDIMEGPK